MSKSLSPDHIARFRRDGFLFPIPLLSADELAPFRSGFAELEAAFGGQLERIDMCHLFFPWAWDLATHPAVLDAVEDLLGPDLIIHGGVILCKYPRTPGYLAWHQDSAYSKLDSQASLTAWIALADSTSANGCLRFVPGSHTGGVLPHPEIQDSDNVLRAGREVQLEIDPSEVVDAAIPGGAMSLHHHDVVHGSGANRADSQRIGFVVRFVALASATLDGPVVLARGGDSGQPNLRRKPPTASTEEGVAAWKAFQAERERG